MKRLILILFAPVLLSSVIFLATAQERIRVFSQTPKTTPSKNAHPSIKLDAGQKLTIEQMTSFFENPTTEFQYDYVENLDDGRGFTVGRICLCVNS